MGWNAINEPKPDWVPVGDVKGPPGPAGPTGPAGAPGAPGASGDEPDLQDLTTIFENGLW